VIKPTTTLNPKSIVNISSTAGLIRTTNFGERISVPAFSLLYFYCCFLFWHFSEAEKIILPLRQLWHCFFSALLKMFYAGICIVCCLGLFGLFPVHLIKY